MAISFQTIPMNNRVPGVFVEYAPQTSVGDQAQATLIIGQVITGGTAPVGVPVLCGSATQAAALAGAGSILSNMAAKYLANDSSATVYLLPLADDVSATKAVGSIALAGTATGSATLGVYVDGQQFQVGVAVGDSAAVVATKIIAAFGQVVTSFTYSANAGTITVTTKNAYAGANDTDLRINYGGSLAGESIPTGITVTLTPFAGGTVNPATGLASALANCTTLAFDYVALPYTDSTCLDLVKGVLDTRWAWNRDQLNGQAFSAFRGTASAATTLGLARNDQYTSIMPNYDSPTHPALWAAAFTATAAVSMKADPALPLNTAVLDVMAPPLQSRFDFAERDTLLFSGMSTFKVAQDGTVSVERAITTNQTFNNVPTDAYLNVERVSTLSAVVRALTEDLKITFARRVLVNDAIGSVPPGSNRVNASLIKGHVVAQYYKQQALGLVQNADTFAKELVVENQGKGKVAILWPADLANQLEQIGVVAAFTSS